MKRKIFALVLVCAVVFSLSSGAATIRLNDGRVIEGEIIEKTDEYLRVDYFGVPLTYYLKDIESVDGEKINVKDSHSAMITAFREKPTEIFRKVTPAIVTLVQPMPGRGKEYLGSGFVIDPAGVVVTNYHIVYPAKTVHVVFEEGEVYPVKSVLYYNASRDVCVLKISRAEAFPSIPLGDSREFSMEETIYCLANLPYEEFTFSNTLLSGVKNFNNLQWLQFIASIPQGNTGGPLIDSEGKAIGVVTFVMRGAKNYNYALAINELKPYLDTSSAMSFAEFSSAISEADYYLMQGNTYLFDEDYSRAISYYEKALQRDPASAVTYNNLGLAYFSLHEPQRALTYYQEALKKDSRFAQAYGNIGKIYSYLEEYHRAAHFYRKALRIKRDYPEVLNKLGLIYYYLGQNQRALNHYEKALASNPFYIEVYNNMGLAYYALGRYRKAIEHYRKAVQLNPQYAQAYNNLGLAYYTVKRYEEAETNYQKALQADPQYADVYNNLGRLYLNRGDYKQAKIYYEMAQSITPHNPVTFEGLGIVHYQLEFYNRAREDFLKAKTLFEQLDNREGVRQIEKYLKQLP